VPSPRFTPDLKQGRKCNFPRLKVGIIGSGVVAQALGKGFAGRDYGVKIGSRTPNSEKLKGWMRTAGKNASTGTFTQAAAYGDIIVLATLGTAVEEAIELAEKKNLDGKVLIDVTNPLDFKGKSVGLFVGTTDSLGERIQRRVPRAKVVKCFNTVGNSQMVGPKHKDAEMLICGDDAGAKEQVAGIVKEFGWKGAIDIGGIEGARWLEALVPLWVRTGAKLNSWDHILAILHD
jgi:8-hydroxy-5-deazaflavin:NADPH oxidoreductase